jgi:cephalosporin-C deacetylase
MALAEPNLDAIRSHRTSLAAPPDLREFWAATIAAARGVDRAPVFTRHRTPLKVIDTFDVVFAGYAGDSVRGWLHLPGGTTEPLPAVVEYPGYGCGRGLAHQSTLWAAAGFAHFVMDVRGQGSTWSVGDTSDPHQCGPTYPGVMTRGLPDRDTYYFRRLFADAVRAVDAARAHPLVRSDQVAVTGASQGGALTIAVSALAEKVVAAMPEVPFLCDIRRACRLTDESPYNEISGYLRTHRDQVESAFATLKYFDCALLAGQTQSPALFSVALMDLVCPPSTVYAAYNAWGGHKSIVEYEFNGHEGGGAFHDVTKIDWLRARLADSEPDA